LPGHRLISRPNRNGDSRLAVGPMGRSVPFTAGSGGVDGSARLTR
jgi:hypothetical protein